MILCLMTNHIHENVYPKQEEFEDTKWVIIIGISKKNKQHNDQNKKYKGTNSDLHNSSTKTSCLSLSLSLSLSLFLSLSLSLSLSRELHRGLGNYEMVRRSSPFENTYDSITQKHTKEKLR